MKCYNCGHDNPPNTTFCFKCASRLDIALFNQPSRGTYIVPQTELTNKKAQAKRSPLSALELICWLIFVAALLWAGYWLWLR